MKHKFTLRCIVFLILFSLAALPVAALTPAYSITGPYLSSTYHENLLSLPRTGDRAFDAVAVALSQLGYHEGNSTADFGGKNQSGSRNFTEYNYALGQVGGTYGYAWCAAFVSWCLQAADAADSAGGLFASCTLWVERLQSLGLYATRSSGYTPKTGDLIFFRSAGVTRASDHVGIVRYVKDGRVYTVEGNSSDRVSLRDYSLKDTYIQGYGKPQYKSTALLPRTALAVEDKVTGWYTVTGDFVNVRAKASTTSSKIGRLSRGDMVRVVALQNGWGQIYHEGKNAYISLDYADFTAPLLYTVVYLAEGGQGCPSNHTYYSMEQATVSTLVPTLENHVFIGWKSASGTLYQPGSPLPAGNLSLTAVWEVQKAEILPEEAPPSSPEAPVPPQESAPTDGAVSGEPFDAPPQDSLDRKSVV